jgi:serine protease Do
VPIATRIRRFHRLAQPSGLLVLDVLADSPAAAAGVQRGDVVVAFDGVSITGADDLHRMLTAERAGRALPLALLRRAELVHSAVTPGEA